LDGPIGMPVEGEGFWAMISDFELPTASNFPACATEGCAAPLSRTFHQIASPNKSPPTITAIAMTRVREPDFSDSNNAGARFSREKERFARWLIEQYWSKAAIMSFFAESGLEVPQFVADLPE